MSQPEYGITLTVTVAVKGPIPNELDAMDWAAEAVQKAIDDARQEGNMVMGVEHLEIEGLAWKVVETVKA